MSGGAPSIVTTPAPVILTDPPEAPTPMGLIAGGGRLPVLVAQGMIEAGHPVRCIGFAGQFDPELRTICEELREVGAMRLGGWRKALQKLGVHHAVMVGRVDKAHMMHSWGTIIRNVPDLVSLRLWFRLRKDRRSHLILSAIADHLASSGIELIDSTAHIQSHLSSAGVMTLKQPTAGQRADAEFGWAMLKEILRLDVGQAIAVRERDVIAVEAIEGTDRMIERAGQLCKNPGWTLLKGARVGHDRRSDVPTIGCETIRKVYEAKGRCIAIASGDVIMIDKPETIRLADELGVAIIGLSQA